MDNKDETVIQEFGSEWVDFNYADIDKNKLKENYDEYFSVFPWDLISKESNGFDMGCGSGRWAQFVAPKVGHLTCIDPSKAIDVAKKNLSNFDNISFLNETTENCSLENASQDFGYSLGVLHHIPNTESALRDCARLLKQGAPILLYLYYNFEHKPLWFKALWKISDYIRKIVSALPLPVKKLVCHLIAYLIYFPLTRIALALEKFGLNVSNFPLSDYRNKPFYQSKNDALDRFGTRLEQRFSRTQIQEMLERTGFHKIEFSPHTPYWCCSAIKKS